MENDRVAEVISALSALRIPAAPGEYDLHEMVRSAFCVAGIGFTHEAAIAPRSRIDFLVGDIGIEIKQGKQYASRLRAQAARYLASPMVGCLIVVTTRGAYLPEKIAGKPTYIIGLNRLWGIALP